MKRIDKDDKELNLSKRLADNEVESAVLHFAITKDDKLTFTVAFDRDVDVDNPTKFQKFITLINYKVDDYLNELYEQAGVDITEISTDKT